MTRILTGASVAVLSLALAGGAFAQARRAAPARAAAAAPAAAAPAPAAAPNVTHGPPITGVCIFSQQSAVGASAAGRAANTRLQQLTAQVKAELQPRETSLQTDIRTFQTQRATLTADARTKQEQALSARAQELQTLERTRTQQLEATRAKAIGQISDRLTPIVQQVYQGRGCSMLLNGDSAVFVANPAMDVTPQVVQQLNTQLPTLSFDLSPPAPAGASKRAGVPDARFYLSTGPLTAGELARLCGADLASADDDTRALRGAAPLDRATGVDVGFLHDRRYVADLRATAAGAVFVAPAQAESAPSGCARLLTPEPLVAYARAAAALHRPRVHGADQPAVHPEAELEDDVELAPGVVIGPGARVGRGTVIGPHAVIGPGVQVGRDCRIGAHVVIGFALIGDRVRILSGAVVGEEGFGVAGGRAGAVDVPQLGRVILQDAVTVGANACIDRGAWEDTVVGENTKIDNLVQVAHNVKLGRNCVLAAHTGISGSCTVGDNVMFGGRAGIADHLTIGDGARIAAAAGVMKDVPPGQIYCGSPARPLRRFMRETAWLARQAKDREDLR